MAEADKIGPLMPTEGDIFRYIHRDLPLYKTNLDQTIAYERNSCCAQRAKTDIC